MTRRFPKLKFDKRGMAVLSGIHVSDLQSIFTAASLHHYETEDEYREGGKEHAEAVRKREENEYGLGELSWGNYQDAVA